MRQIGLVEKSDKKSREKLKKGINTSSLSLKFGTLKMDCSLIFAIKRRITNVIGPLKLKVLIIFSS